MPKLSNEQKQIIDDLRSEVAGLSKQANVAQSDLWEKFRNGGEWDDEKYNEVFALDGQAAMLDLIAHVPTAGEKKVSKIRKQISRLLRQGDAHGLRLARNMQARLDALDSVNEWRDSLGLPLLDKLPRGINGDSQECTLARALKWKFNSHRDLEAVTVGGETADIRWFDSELGMEQQQSPVIDGHGTVVRMFDEDEYLDLIEHQRLVVMVIQSTNPAKFWGEMVRRAKDPLDDDHDAAVKAVEFLVRVAVEKPDHNMVVEDWREIGLSSSYFAPSDWTRAIESVDKETWEIEFHEPSYSY